MTVDHVAVLDVGKTNVKLCVFAPDGATAAEDSIPNRVLPGPPYPHADTETIWAFALDRLRAAARLPIGAVVVTTHGATGALLARGADPDTSGLALPVLDYEHDGPDEIETDYAPLRPPFAETASPPLPHGLNLGRQIAWQARRHPEGFARAGVFLAYPQYFAWRFSGVAASEATSLACHGDLWEPATGRPSRLVDALGIRELLPPLARPDAVLGPIRPAVAAATGLRPDTEVLCGIHDSNASLVPHLDARAAPFAVLSTGTWVIAMAIGGDPARLDPTADMLANVDARGRPVPCARFMGGREFAAVVGGGEPPLVGEADLRRIVAAGAMALPPFASEGGAHRGRRGGFAGPVPEDPAGRAATATLMLALEAAEALERLGADRWTVVVEGSFAGNAAFLAVLQGLLPSARIRAAAGTAGTAYGAHLLARGGAPAGSGAGERAAPAWDLPGLATYAARWRARVAGDAPA